MPVKPRNGEKGFALVITLLILTILVVTGLELNREARVEATMAGNFRDMTQAYYIAQSGVEMARALLQNDDPTYDGPDEKWAQFETLSVLASRFFSEGQFTGRITDENSKFNPKGLIGLTGMNLPSMNLDSSRKRKQLERLLSLLGQRSDWIDALLDWTDTDDFTRVGGAERDYYMSLKKPYPAKNEPLSTMEELLLVKGVDRDVFYGKEGREGIKDYITVSSDGWININTASIPVLMSLSPLVDKGMAQAVLAYRKGKPFRNTSELRAVPGWGTVAQAIGLDIGVNSSFFSVEVVGSYREARSVIQAVIQRQGMRTKIISWKAG